MAEVWPFRGIRYNEVVVGDLAKVICPPYDVISPQAQEELHRRSEYNFVRLEYGLNNPEDDSQHNRYSRAAQALKEWLDQGVLALEEKPAIYLHEHRFLLRGQWRRRREVIARLCLEEWGTGVVRPHEGTLAQPKLDRLNLMNACQANLSPIMALYRDNQAQIDGLFDDVAKGTPAKQDVSGDRETHRLWVVDRESSISSVIDALAKGPVYIADGHHRYETALAYRIANPELAGASYAMLSLISAADPGLVILPVHRLLRSPSRQTAPVIQQLAAAADIKPVGPIPNNLSRLVRQLELSKTVAFGFLVGQEAYLVTPHDDVVDLLPEDHCSAWRSLDVSILEYGLMRRVFDAKEGDGWEVAFSEDASQAAARILSGDFDLAFLLRATDVSQVIAVADAGDRMPRKSTYFYPKVPAGLLVNPLWI